MFGFIHNFITKPIRGITLKIISNSYCYNPFCEESKTMRRKTSSEKITIPKDQYIGIYESARPEEYPMCQVFSQNVTNKIENETAEFHPF